MFDLDCSSSKLNEYHNLGSQRSSLLKSNGPVHENHFWVAGLNWSYGNAKVNLSHYVYGNRKNIGYKYFSWNCDRGLISKHKIEDVRVFAARHRPHFIAVSFDFGEHTFDKLLSAFDSSVCTSLK